MVRSCALGALGHLRSTLSTAIIRKCFQEWLQSKGDMAVIVVAKA